MQYGVPSAAVVLLAIALGNGFFSQQANVELATEEAVEPGSEYTQEEIVQALQDLEIAIDYLGQISQRTNVMIEDRFLLRQLENSINATFRDGDADAPVNEDSNGPI